VILVATDVRRSWLTAFAGAAGWQERRCGETCRRF
jgi:hypothetical protein